MGRFVDFLQELNGGIVADELTQRFNELSELCVMTRKPGTITLKLTMTPNGEQSVEIKHEIKDSTPEPARAKAIFFVEAGGGLRRDDPRQERLPLREITAQAEPREMAPKAAPRDIKQPVGA